MITMNFDSNDSRSSSIDTTNSYSSTPSGWHRYQKALVKAGVQEHLHRWYVIHVKTFLACFAGKRLTDLNAGDITDHFLSLNSLQFDTDWKHQQYIDAVHILISNTADLKWGNEVCWDDFTLVAISLPLDHTTIARETDGIKPVEPQFDQSLPESHKESLLLLSRVLRL